MPPVPRSLLLALLASPGLAAPVEYNRDVRPILADRCFACHGPDANQRQAGLRLDREDAATAPLKSGRTAVVPGKPSGSELIRRIDSSDADDRMPPASSGKSLAEAERSVLRAWIEQGAKWQGHWAFLPIVRPRAPAVENASLARNDIDRFILARLEAQGMKPAAEADRTALVRRLSFDLTGLPPATELVERFTADRRPEAYEVLVEELLSSPAFGERMAMWWLDLARYADTVGYHGDQDQSVWPYRDYVIRAFNDNLPFDRFTLEQIAGDILDGAAAREKVASGYNRLAMKSAEGGVQDKEYLAKYAAERVRAVSGAWMGATLGCAECHDHKFDPFTTRDFYRFAAFWADMSERGIYGGAESNGDWGPSIPLPRPEDEAELRRLDGEIAGAQPKLDTRTSELEAEQAAWEKSLGVSADWTVLMPATAGSTGGAMLTVRDDGSIVAGGANPDTDTYTVTVPAALKGITALRLEALTDPSLPKKGPGRAGNGNFVLTELTVSFRAAAGAGDTPLGLQNPSASHEQTTLAEKNPYGRWAIEAAIDGDARGAGFGWAILDRAREAHAAVFELKVDFSAEDGGVLTFVLKQNHGNGGHNLGCFRLSATASPRPVRVVGAGLPATVREALATEPSRRGDAQKAEVARHFLAIAPSLEPVRKKLAGLRRDRDQTAKGIPKMLTTVAVAPRAMRVLPRGNWMDDSGEVVAPAVPAFLARTKTEGDRATRKDLARWLTSPENPLTARNIANRLWKLFFGAGLSRRLEDLGAQGDWPSHPELLDCLAAELRGAWDVKGLVRLIVTSGAYRQSSLATPEMLERDPYNRFLGRQGRFRLDAEMVRDAALETSGLLWRRIGGPSARPYQPPGYWSYLNFPMREYQNDSGESQYRRGLYTHWQRQYLHPSLLAFDAPTREECTADRIRSSTPLQALVLLNDPSYVEAARVFAERVIREGGTEVDSRIAWAVWRALSRPVRPAEAEVLASLYRKHRAGYVRDSGAAEDLLSTGQRPAPKDIEPAELAAWTSVARAILNLHETITRS